MSNSQYVYVVTQVLSLSKGYVKIDNIPLSVDLGGQIIYYPANQEDLDKLNIIGESVPKVKTTMEELGF